jgi:starvation-inducible DNA-binding protein
MGDSRPQSSIRDAVPGAGDADTADIFVNYSRSLDKALWFIEAHLQEAA